MRNRLIPAYSTAMLAALACAPELEPQTGRGASAGEVTIRSALPSASEVQPFAPPSSWTPGEFLGTRGTFVADVTGDGRADAIAVNDGDISVMQSNGTGFEPAQSWSSTPFYGTKGTFFADVTGDGRADAIAVNDGNILVRAAPPTGAPPFDAQQEWLTSAFYGTRGTFFVDLTKDGRADAIKVDDHRLYVRPAPSSGFGFGGQQTWSTTSNFYGTKGTFFADVTGDGYADVITVNDNDIFVRRGVGTQPFGSPVKWSETAFWGTRGTYIADVTGDGLADVVKVTNNGITMRRSGRWFFGANEELMSDLGLDPYALPALANVDEAANPGGPPSRADFVQLYAIPGMPLAVRLRKDRAIPIRFVQFVWEDACSAARSDQDVQLAIDNANGVFRDAGIRFYPVAVDPATNDCPGFSSSHVVESNELAELGGPPGGVPAYSEGHLAKAKNAFNSGCNMGYSEIAGKPLGEQVWWVAARCGLPGEALAYVSSFYTNAANDAGDGKLIAYDRNDAWDLANNHFAHELGHYLGLPHMFSIGYGVHAYVDPATGQGQPMAAFWDLVFRGPIFFKSRAEATWFETNLVPIQNGDPSGWFCPSQGNTCPFPFLPGGQPPAGTVAIPLGGGTQYAYTYEPHTTTFDHRLKGIAPRFFDNKPGVNTMSYGYAGQPSFLRWGVSLSQIEVIQANLKTDILTKYLDASGRVIFGDRPRLGIAGPAAALSYVNTGGLAKAGSGTLATNGWHTWTIGTNGYDGGNQVYEWNGRMRTWESRTGGALKIALPSGGENLPWAITGTVPGPVKRWNGSTFENLPGDPQAQGCSNGFAVGDHTPEGRSAWSLGCFGPNWDGNYKIQRYRDSTGWQWTSGAGEGWGAEITTDFAGTPWVLTKYAGGQQATLFRGTLTADGTLTGWTEVPPPSGVTPTKLTGGTASNNSYLRVSFLASDGHIYVYSPSSSTWGDNGATPFPPAQIAGTLPYLWLVNDSGQIIYAR